MWKIVATHVAESGGMHPLRVGHEQMQTPAEAHGSAAVARRVPAPKQLRCAPEPSLSHTLAVLCLHAAEKP